MRKFKFRLYHDGPEGEGAAASEEAGTPAPAPEQPAEETAPAAE